MSKTFFRSLCLLFSLLFILTFIPCGVWREVRAYTAAQRPSLKPEDVTVSRERFLRSAKAHIDRANQVGYGFNNILTGSEYIPLQTSTRKFCCVDLVTHVLYTATASMIGGKYHPIDGTLAARHSFAGSNGLVFNTSGVGALRRQLAAVPQLYSRLTAPVNKNELRMGDIVISGSKSAADKPDSSAANQHATLVIGKVTPEENAYLKIPNYSPHTSYFISQSSSRGAEWVSTYWYDRQWNSGQPDKGYFISNVFRIKWDVLSQDRGGISVRKVDAVTGAGLAGAEFDLKDAAGALRKHIVMTSASFSSEKEFEPGIYTLTETKAPAGYTLDPALRTIVIGMDKINTVFFDNPIKNTPADGRVKVVKKDAETGAPVPGAVFDLSQSSAFPLGNTIRVTTGTDGATEPQSFQISNGTTVYAREVSVPAPYLLDPTVKQTAISAGNEVTAEFADERARGRIEVIKRDAVNQHPIEGAVFEVKSAAHTLVDTIRTGADGKAATKELPLGTYTLREVAPAEGYNESTEVFALELAYKDMLTPVVTARRDIENAPIQGRILIKKLSSGGDEPIEGAVFELFDSGNHPASDLNGRRVSALKTDEKGEVLTPLLRYGTYIIRETGAPDEYYLNPDSHEVVIAANEKVETCTVRDDQVLLRLRVDKTDEQTAQPLRGVAFQVFDSAGCLIEWNANVGGVPTIIDRLITNEEGTALSPGTLPIGSYTLKEVKKPDGYASSEDIRFEITRETAYLEIPAVGKVLAIPVGNRPIQVDISKKAMTGDEELPGASLRVIDKATGTVADEWVSGETAHRIEHLTAGRTYILRETIAPDGYAVASDIEFTLSDTGEVQTVVMRDEMIEIPSETTAVTNQPEITTIHHAPEKTTATTAGLTTTAPSGATAVLTEHEPSENPLSGLSEPSVSPEAPTTASEKTVPAPLRTPRTGENAPRLLAGAGLIIAAGIIIAILLRETRHKEKRT